MSDRAFFACAWLQYLGAHDVADVRARELNRAWLRILAGLAVALVAFIERLAGAVTSERNSLLLVVVLAYVAAGVAYRQVLKPGRRDSVPLLSTFLILDPAMVVFVLATDPERFAFLAPLLLVVLIQCGSRYGVRAMYLSWSVAVLGSLLLLTNPFWRARVELSLAVLLMLILVPALFVPLVRRAHKVRSIEEDRARVAALSETVAGRSAFLAKVSHELRSPLQGIVSALDVLELRHGRTRDDELIGRIRRSAQLLNTHLRDMLTLANGEAGRLEMRPEPFDACALLESVAAAASDLAAAKRLELVVDVPPGAVFVVADSSRIDQVLTNLVINSIKYTDAGQVRLSMRPYEPSTGLLRLAVADTGPGLPEHVLPTLLTPDRVVTGGERRGEGSGIGLAIVRTLVERLGGTIAVASRLGHGTTFTLEIPAEPVASMESADTTDGH